MPLENTLHYLKNELHTRDFERNINYETLK